MNATSPSTKQAMTVIIPVRPAAGPAHAADTTATRGLLRRTLGRGNASRRTLGRGNASRRTLGKNNPQRRALRRTSRRRLPRSWQ